MSLPRKYMVEKRVGGTCVHYRQHYVRTEQGNYYPLWYGHCIHPWRRHPECLSYRIRMGKSKRTDRSQKQDEEKYIRDASPPYGRKDF